MLRAIEGRGGRAAQGMVRAQGRGGRIHGGEDRAQGRVSRGQGRGIGRGVPGVGRRARRSWRTRYTAKSFGI